MGHLANARAAAAASLLSNSNGYQAKCSVVSKNCGGVLKSTMVRKSYGLTENFMLKIELRKKILTFRDVIDLPPCDGSCPIHELVIGTVEDLHKLYPNVLTGMSFSPEMEEFSTFQGLVHLYKALRSIVASWAKTHRWITNLEDSACAEDFLENINLEQLGGRLLAKLKSTTDMAKQIFDMMDEDEKNNEGSNITGGMLSESYSYRRMACPSPDSTIPIPPELTYATKLGEFGNASNSRQLLLPLRLQALGTLQPIDMNAVAEDRPIAENHSEGPNDSNAKKILPKIPDCDPHLSSEVCIAPPPSPLPKIPPVNASAAAPLPPIPPAKVPMPAPVPSMPLTKGAAPPPPPPLGVARALRPKATTKLKRSSHMGSLYRVLKVRVEGSSLDGKQPHGRKSPIGGSSGGKQGMADALAEMARRSSYFQQIEEDVEKHSKSIMEVKSAISSFQTKDMDELIKFHKYVEQILEKLTDETQVLARFEGFPTKKLESLRTAAALHLKLEGKLTSLQNWKLELPLDKHLDKVESYFKKIKEEVDALERTKDEESKRFQSQNIHFDFSILVRLKEAMVDVSSGCMELAIKEGREAKALSRGESGWKTKPGQANAHTKMLWKAFQFAFRVYSFAGGQDDRADMLTRELAHEIETDPQQD